MRDELAELLGQPVVLAGRLNRCEPNAIGNLNVCLKAVDVYPWRTDVAISSLIPLRVDHGWLQISRLEHSVGGIVEMYWMTAEISNYQRKNGSRDIGFRHRPSLCLDHLLDTILNIDEHDEQVQIMHAALRRIQNRDQVFGFYCSPQHIEALLQQALQRFDQVSPYNANAFLKAQAMYIKNSRKRPTSPHYNSISAKGFNVDI